VRPDRRGRRAGRFSRERRGGFDYGRDPPGRRRLDRSMRRRGAQDFAMTQSHRKSRLRGNGVRAADRPKLPGQVVLVLQGGGALGAYQVGVYTAMHEARIEPDWIIGTSIGAINAALIAGNAPQRRLERLHAFWDRVEQRAGAGGLG